ncbi:paired box protein Pax-1-like [Euwallacea fornicatus]|uniref:paired box protein Pax-1-like n=1 Tax=Euwallacea fornicatus TaxID=995702 RepID=UPI00338EF44C
MPTGRYLSQNLQSKIIGVFQNGTKQADIAKHFSIHKSVLSKVLSRYKTRGNVIICRRGGGRPRKTNKNLDRQIKRIAMKQPNLSARGILNELGVDNLSYKTVQRRCNEVGIVSRRPAKTPFISSKNRKSLFAFAQKYLHCDQTF